MKRVLLFIALCIFSHSIGLHAQQENVWAFGNHAGLDFNSGSPVAITTNMNSMEGCASICSSEGQLLFYTEGSFIWDKYGMLMPNGSNLTPIPSFNTPPISPTSSTSQGAVIVPDPGNPQQYYIFSLTSAENWANAGRLYYSKVDMSLNGGMGDVIPGEKGILLDTLLSERMGAIVGDRCNYWLMVCGQDLVFRAYRITDAGITSAPVLSPVMLGQSGNVFVFGQLIFSPDRHKMAVTQFGFNGIGSIACGSLYDFDPATGLVSNGINLIPLSIGIAYGVCFSPDSHKLYLNKSDTLYQYTLSPPVAADILSSKTGIASNNNNSPGTIKQGPDNRLYLQNAYSNGLAVINYPNLSGMACGYTNTAISLQSGTFHGSGLPNTVPIMPHDTFYTHQAVAAPCFGGSFAITAPDDSTGWDYVWNTGVVTAALSPDSPGAYWITYRTPPCNYHVDTFHVSFPYGVLPHIRTDTACAGMANGSAYAFTYSGDTVAYHYVWTNTGGDTLSLSDSLSGITAGDYILHIATASCDTTLNITTPAINDKVSFTVPDTLVCTGELLAFQNTSAPGYTAFTWQFGDGNTSDAYSPAYQYENSGAYTACLIGHGSICSDTACRSIMVDAPVDSFSFHPGRTLLCTGEHIVLDAVTDSTLTGYDWSFGDESRLYTDKSTTEHAYDKDGIYIISLTGKFRACPDITLNDSIRVYPFPVVRLGQDSVLCLGSSPIHLENLTVNAGGTCHYEWSTGDTTESMEIRHPDIYSLTVTQEPAGCASTDVVTVSKDCYIDIPNAFTPNGDGVNDYFFPRQYLSRSVTQFRMQVLNRWGQKVFETTSIEGRGWDARFNDKEQPAGVYVYIIDVTLDNNRQEHYEGNVTLLR